MDTCLEHFATERTVLKACEDGLLRGIDDDDAVGGLATTHLRILLALGNVGLAETSEILPVINPYHGMVGRLGKEVAPLLLQLRDTGVDFLHTRHLLGRQECT